MKYLISNQHALTPPVNWPEPISIQKPGELTLLTEEGVNLSEAHGCSLYFDGYLRDLDRGVEDISGQQQSVIQELRENWPLARNYTGSFSATLIDEQNGKITLSTDQVGLYPLYYLQKGDHFYISNSIILMGAVSGCDFDLAGIVQRSLGPDHATIGSRTILKGCKRLLPGECLRWNMKGEVLQQAFDNRLFQEMSDSAVDAQNVTSYWKAYKKEVEYCLNTSKKVNIALSGGIDSRIVLGAVPDEKEINCYTYGDPENYETRIASKLCRLKHGEFHACSNPDLYFPAPEVFREKVIATEAVELCSWLEITEAVENRTKEPLLLGELCEALPARNIKKFSSKEFRRKNFLKYYIKNQDYPFTKGTTSEFRKWKEKVVHQYSIYYHERNLSKFKFSIDKEELLAALRNDLEELFSRVEAHQLPYTELYEELFSWYTFTRMHLAKHLLVAGSKFQAYSPAMSLQMLTLTSAIHPNQRLNYRFAKELFKNSPDLKKFRKVPTAQAPLVSQSAPDLVKFAMWGVRSMGDQFLIRRMMKNRDPENRYRMFKSINWAQVYQHPKMETHLEAYFTPNEIGERFYEDLHQQVVARKELTQWPFANLNIINLASLNVELNSIKAFQKR